MGLTQNLGRLSPSIFTDSSLNVGIGAAPSGTYKFEVTGTAKVSSTLLVSGASTLTGNVGIGTTTTDFPLVVKTDASANSIKILGRTSGDTKVVWYSSDNATQYAHIDIGAAYFQMYASNSQSIQFYNGATNSLTLASTGAATFSSSVTSSANESSFGSASTAGTTMTIQAGSGNGAIRFKNAAGGDGTLLIQGTSSSIIYRFDTYSVGNAFQISNAGVITIGQIGSGTVTATSGVLSAVSDMNLKIEDGFIDNALEKVMNLKPRYYHWKEESGLPTDIRQLGFYAQEVNEAIGEEGANTPKNENDKWGIYDRAIIAMLTKAMQEQNEVIEDLKSRLDKAGL